MKKVMRKRRTKGYKDQSLLTAEPLEPLDHFRQIAHALGMCRADSRSVRRDGPLVTPTTARAPAFLPASMSDGVFADRDSLARRRAPRSAAWPEIMYGQGGPGDVVCADDRVDGPIAIRACRR